MNKHLGMSWEEHKKQLLKDPKLRRIIKARESQFNLAKQLIELRLKKKMTQTQLAKKAKTNQVVISRIEGGSENPRYETLVRIVHALDKEIKFI